jgi:hypothetical protein
MTIILPQKAKQKRHVPTPSQSSVTSYQVLGSSESRYSTIYQKIALRCLLYILGNHFLQLQIIIRALVDYQFDDQSCWLLEFLVLYS